MNKILYKLDNYLVKHASAKLWLLGLLSLFSIGVGASLLLFNHHDYLDALWKSWTYLVDPGTHVEVKKGYDRAIAVIITIVGMLIFALLIGLISEVVNDKIDGLRKGKTKVYEEDHFVILGWSERMLTLIEQINLSEKYKSVVILSSKDKSKMEDYICKNTAHLSVDIICRTGNTGEYFSLDQVNVQSSSGILILADSFISFSDEVNLKVLLMLLKNFKVLDTPITIELEKDSSQSLFDSLDREYENLNLIYMKDSLDRLLAQSCVYTGVTKVYEQLFDYYGDSFGLIHCDKFHGRALIDISETISNSACCGIYSMKDKALIIDNSYLYQKGDKLLVLQKDNENKYCKPKKYTTEQTILKENERLRILIIGCNKALHHILQELNMSGQFEVIIASRNEVLISKRFSNLSIATFTYHQINDLKKFEMIDRILLIPEESYQTSIQQDSNVLAILMALDTEFKETLVTAEIFDPTTKNLLIKQTFNDYIVSNNLASKLLASVCYSNELKIIYNDLLSAGGNLIKILRNPMSEIKYIDLYYSLLEEGVVLLGCMEDGIVFFNLEDNEIIGCSKYLIVITHTKRKDCAS